MRERAAEPSDEVEERAGPRPNGAHHAGSYSVGGGPFEVGCGTLTIAMRRRPPLARYDVAINAVVLASLSAPLVLSAYAVAASFAFSPEAIARQEHVAFLGVKFAPCPGCVLCGMSRAFSAFAHGDVARAMELNAGVVAFFPLFCLMVIGFAVGIVRLVRSPIRLTPPREEMPNAMTSHHDPMIRAAIAEGAR